MKYDDVFDIQLRIGASTPDTAQSMRGCEDTAEKTVRERDETMQITVLERCHANE